MEIRYSDEQFHEWLRNIPLKTLCNLKLLEQWQKENDLNSLELSALMTMAIVAHPCYRRMPVDPDIDMTFGQMLDLYEQTRVQFIIIHRVNYILHQCMITVYDLLENDKRFKFMVKKNFLKAEDAWRDYEEPRRKKTERTAWYTLQDHFGIMSNLLEPKLEKVFIATRDYMIGLGLRDVELKARIVLALQMFKVHFYSFKAFFKEIYDNYGIDFSLCYEEDRMDNMEKYFSMMCDELGERTEKDERCGHMLKGFRPENSQRITWAWDDFLEDLRDADLMDKAAEKAISLNPKVQEDYKAAIEDEERKQREKAAAELSEKYKVTKKSK